MDGKRAAAGCRVLLIGYRAGLGRALEAFGVPYVVWSEAPLKQPPRGVEIRVAPFGRSGQSCRRAAEELREFGPFTHVIGGTENSVVVASYARRVLGARLSTHTTAHRCHDKLEMKIALSRHGVPMTDFIDGNSGRSWSDLRGLLGSPLVVKNRRAAGGVGIDIVDGAGDGSVQLRNRIVERFVDAPEASVESFVFNGSVVFENVTEYHRKRFVNIVPAPPAVDHPGGVRGLSRQVIEKLRIAWGVTHMEAFLHPEGPLFGEIALRPPGGYIMDLIGMAYGFDAWSAFVAVELGLPFYVPERPVAHAAALLLHPGAGCVRRIEGLEQVRAHPCVSRARLRVKVGQQVGARSSVSRTVGHVLLRAPDRAKLLRALRDVDETLRIEVV